MYVDGEAVASGRWRIIGHDKDLRTLWPPTPEIYHRPRNGFPGAGVGPHGAAETPDGTLRQLSEEEAREVGLFDSDVQQIYAGKQLERRLNAATR